MALLRILTMRPDGYPAATHAELDLQDDAQIGKMIRENLVALGQGNTGVAVMTIMIVVPEPVFSTQPE